MEKNIFFVDLTMRDMSLEPSPIDERDWIAESIYPEDSDVPPVLDLRNRLPEVKDQGQQGTCAAQTASAMKEWEENLDCNITEPMSAQFVYNLRANYPSSGMYPRDVMKILNKYGICKESLFEYGKILTGKDDIPDNALEDGKKYLIESYAQVSTISALKKALYKNGPCLIAVPVYNADMKRMWKKEPGSSKIGGHAMTVVGYNKEGFILRNSWGKFWNRDGHTIFPYADWGMQYEVWTAIDAKSGMADKISWFYSLYLRLKAIIASWKK